MSQSEVLIECDNDEALVRGVLGSGVSVRHHSGKSTVSQRLQEQKMPTRAMVDEDPDSNQPSYLKSLGRRRFPSHGLVLLRDPKRGHLVVVLSPRLEDWLLATAQAAGVHVEEFDLPTDVAQFKHAARNNPSKFAMLIRKLASTPRVELLKSLLSTGAPPAKGKAKTKRPRR